MHTYKQHVCIHPFQEVEPMSNLLFRRSPLLSLCPAHDMESKAEQEDETMSKREKKHHLAGKMTYILGDVLTALWKLDAHINEDKRSDAKECVDEINARYVAFLKLRREMLGRSHAFPYIKPIVATRDYVLRLCVRYHKQMTVKGWTECLIGRFSNHYHINSTGYERWECPGDTCDGKKPCVVFGV